MEYVVDVEFPMQSLYIAKSFYDHGKLKSLLPFCSAFPTICTGTTAPTTSWGWTTGS